MCNFRNSFKHHNNMGQLTKGECNPHNDLNNSQNGDNVLFKVLYFDISMPIENLIIEKSIDKKLYVHKVDTNAPIFKRYTEHMDKVSHIFFNKIFEESKNKLYFTREFRDIIDITIHKGNKPIIYINHNELVLFNNLREQYENDLEQRNTTSVDGYRLLNLLQAISHYQSKLQIRTVEYEFICSTSTHVINTESFTIRRFVPNNSRFKVVEEENICI